MKTVVTLRKYKDNSYRTPRFLLINSQDLNLDPRNSGTRTGDLCTGKMNINGPESLNVSDAKFLSCIKVQTFIRKPLLLVKTKVTKD